MSQQRYRPRSETPVQVCKKRKAPKNTEYTPVAMILNARKTSQLKVDEVKKKTPYYAPSRLSSEPSILLKLTVAVLSPLIEFDLREDPVRSIGTPPDIDVS